MIGVIRLMRWDRKFKLPVQKIFGVNPLDAIENIKDNSTVWHIGRFVICRSKGITNFTLFKQLMIYALTPVYGNVDDIIIAECDSKLIRGLTALGFKFNFLGKSQYYIGSETFPIYLTHSGFSDFFEKYKGLV